MIDDIKDGWRNMPGDARAITVILSCLIPVLMTLMTMLIVNSWNRQEQLPMPPQEMIDKETAKFSQYLQNKGVTKVSKLNFKQEMDDRMEKQDRYRRGMIAMVGGLLEQDGWRLEYDETDVYIICIRGLDRKVWFKASFLDKTIDIRVLSSPDPVKVITFVNTDPDAVMGAIRDRIAGYLGVDTTSMKEYE